MKADSGVGMFGKIGTVIATVLLCAGSAGAAAQRPSEAEPSRAELREAYAAVDKMDLARLQKDSAYAKETLVHLDMLKRVSAGDSETMHALDSLRVLALIGMARYQDALDAGVAAAAAKPAMPEIYPGTLVAAQRAKRPLQALALLELAARHVKGKSLRELQELLPAGIIPQLIPQIEAAGGEAAKTRAAEALTTLGLSAN